MFREEAKPLGWWQVNADTLAGSRFVLSALAETIASLMVLARGCPGTWASARWLDTHRARVPGAAGR